MYPTGENEKTVKRERESVWKFLPEEADDQVENNSRNVRIRTV